MLISRLLLLFTVIIWGWTFVATKVCLQYVNPIELLGLRMIIAMPVLLAIAGYTSRPSRTASKRISLRFPGSKKRILLASAIITTHFLVQITGIKYTSATNTGWIVSLTPLVVAVLAFFILKERLRRNILFGIAVASAGILLLVSKGKLTDIGWLSSYGDWLVLGSAHTWALYTIVTRDISRTHDPVAVTIAVLLPSLILAVGIMLATSDWSIFLKLPRDAMFALLFLGLFGTALGHWFWQMGVARIGAAEAAIFLYLEPVATTALAVPYLHESFGVFTALGGALVIFGVWLAQRRGRG